VPKKTAEEMAADAALNVTFGKERGANNWKWKEKEVTDLVWEIL